MLATGPKPRPRSQVPKEVYSVRVFAEGAAHFGVTGRDHFDLDDYQDACLPHNMIRLYALAAATAPRSEAVPIGAVKWTHEDFC